MVRRVVLLGINFPSWICSTYTFLRKAWIQLGTIAVSANTDIVEWGSAAMCLLSISLASRVASQWQSQTIEDLSFGHNIDALGRLQEKRGFTHCSANSSNVPNLTPRATRRGSGSFECRYIPISDWNSYYARAQLINNLIGLLLRINWTYHNIEFVHPSCRWRSEFDFFMDCWCTQVKL